MDTTTQNQEAPAVCPFHAAAAQPEGLTPETELFLPLHKRFITQYAKSESGAPELRLYYADKEISFDEPELFAFGETLAAQSRFAAGAATAWGEGYDWPRVRELLEQLLEEGVLQHAGPDSGDPRPVASRDGARPSPLPRASAKAPRSWLECEALMRELTGRPLEPGHLELVIPIFRVAHMALDAEGRQVGEANVFPKALRLDVPTKWRTCIYAGSRFQPDRPMNVTALKTMRAHWPQMMLALSRIREAYLARFPDARQGWTVGHIERLATLVLAVPTYVLMRRDNRVANGELNPVLSSLFRVSDGLRMTMHQMLFVPVGEPTLPPDAPMTGAEIYAYAERNYSFHSEHGVCAGPQAMIHEFLGVLVDGHLPKDAAGATLDAEVREVLDDIDPIADYALLGLQAYAAVFSIWPIMTRAYESLAGVADAHAERSTKAAELRDRLRSHIERIRSATFLANETWRADRDQVYADMYAQCAFGVTGERPATPLDERLAAALSTQCDTAMREMRTVLERYFADAHDGAEAMIQDTLDCLARFFLQTQAVLQVAGEVQRKINALLGRDSPLKPFTAADIDLHNRLQGEDERRLPYLLDELEKIFGARIEITADTIDIELRMA